MGSVVYMAQVLLKNDIINNNNNNNKNHVTVTRKQTAKIRQNMK